MKPFLIDLYTQILLAENAVTFENNNTIYRIWKNDDGWYMENLTESENSLWDPDGEHVTCDAPWIETDGGQCTGSARDAVEFWNPPNTIKTVVIESAVTVEFEDGTKKELFRFYPDEISFSPSEFIGLTEEQARKLRFDKDIAYLRS